MSARGRAGADPAVLAAARERHDRLTKPPGSLGRLEELGIRLAGAFGRARPVVEGRIAVVFAADHGVAAHGVSAYPQEVTAQMVRTFLTGGAAVTTLARAQGTPLHCVDVGVVADLPDHPRLWSRRVARGTADLATTAAMTAAERDAALAVGVEVASALCEPRMLVACGEMGIANTTAAAALTAAMTGADVAAVTGRGTGVSDAAFGRKREVVASALALHRADPDDPLEVLRLLGGLEVAALVGFIGEAAARRCAVVLDGFIVTAAAVIAAAVDPAVVDHMVAAHVSQEPGHRIQLAHLGLDPVLDLDLRLGEGSGAVLALPVLASAAAVLDGMATFDEAGVDGPTTS